MIIQPRKYKSEHVSPVLTIETRQTRLGDLFFYVTFYRDGQEFGYAFSSLDSAVDFVNSNFNPKFRMYGK